jgi:hypothetical protein
MSFTTMYTGEVALLKYMLNYSAADNVKVHLYTNNYAPAKSDVLANYTESSAAGYSPITLVGSQFTVATVSSTSSAVYARQTFTYTTAENVYGYYITNNAASILIWAEEFSGAPFMIPSGGGTVGIDPNIIMSTC